MERNMKLVNKNIILNIKNKRKEKLIDLGAKESLLGIVFHYGKISPGCRACFSGEHFFAPYFGNKCMCKCPYCYYDENREEETEESVENTLRLFKLLSERPKLCKFAISSYQSQGETLFYLDYYKKFSELFLKACKNNNITPYIFLYTNGILCTEKNLKTLKEMQVTELRFHISASNFSNEVFKNMSFAQKMGFTVTVEEPSWPLHKQQLFNSLPKLEDIGCKHLNLIEVAITKYNMENIKNIYSSDKYSAYKDYAWHLYDNGLVYDIMEEVINKNYSFSVLDCNSEIEKYRRTHEQNVLFDWDLINGICDEWDYGVGFEKNNKQTYIDYINNLQKKIKL